jgi:hypothetical protein
MRTSREGLRYVVGDDGVRLLTGTLNILDGQYMLVQQFNIVENSVMEYNGDPTDPTLRITAATPSRRTEGGSWVQICIDIDGTRRRPVTRFRIREGSSSNLTTADEHTGTQSAIDADAVVFLALGKFQSEIGPQGLLSYTSTGGTVGQTAASLLLNGLLKESGYSVDVEYNDKELLASRVKASKQLGKFLISAGVRPSAGRTSLDASIEFSLGDVLNVLWLEHTRLRVERRATDDVVSGNSQTEVYSARMGILDLARGIAGGVGALWHSIFGGGDPQPRPEPAPVPAIQGSSR